ncbi:MAG TPA: N-acetylmuramoyl-L-alanine amidase, partial [Anaeromyxobacter sp.]
SLAAALALALAAREPAFTVVIDPGHGGEQEGAIAPDGAREKDVSLAIARRIGARLKRLGAKVVLTRTGDISVPLANRAAIATAIRADMFLSVHLNSMPTPQQRRYSRGVETYFLSADATDGHAKAVAARENADRLAGEAEADPNDPVAGILDDLQDAASLQGSSRLAYAVHEKLVQRLGAEDRGVKQAPFYVLAGARMPAVLLEVGFISHAEETRKLRTREYQERIAEAVADGIRSFRAETRRASR